MKFKILVIDDEPILRNSLGVALNVSGHDVVAAQTGEEGLELFRRENPDLILLDHWLPGMNGDEVLRQIRTEDPDVPVIIMTAQGSIDLAVNAMKQGAFDFLVKPFDLDHLETVVQKALERIRIRKEVEWLREQYREKFRTGIIAESPGMKGALDLAEKAARGIDTTILIEGETGTGKELLAEYIHYLSPRSSFPFIPLNCGAIPKDLFESELFGYEKGAFTGASEKGKIGKVEAAEKGTLFLDEVVELTAAAQVKVLRVLEEKEYYRVAGVERKRADVRIIAATNRNLDREVEKGNFRSDLYFRLNVVKLCIPPLRARREDILPLFRFFIERFNEQFKKRFFRIEPGAERRLLSHPWPGNVREVRNTAERIVLLERGETVRETHLASLGAGAEIAGKGRPALSPEPEGLLLDEVEKSCIREALRIKGGNKVQAARLLGITRSALLYRIEKHGIEG